MRAHRHTRKLLLAAIVIPLVLLTIACEREPMPDDTDRPAAGRLTRDYAAGRAARISSLAYRLELLLEDDATSFSGTVIATFDLADRDRPLTLDFTDGEIASVSVNGQPRNIDYNGSFLRIDNAELATGRNEIRVGFRHPYSRTGQGLHRYVDPEDGRVYLHTHFEPYDANRLFPCFDQPDLKARFTVEVSAPAAWTVISATRESDVVDEGVRRRWRFPATRPISTYIFPLHAGEYAVWEAEADGIPLRLFARHGLAEHVRPDDWFDLTRDGFRFFQDYFDLPYPYGKYDQLIVPEFNIGGMENVAAVTYSERYVRRGDYTREDMLSLSNVLLHEMSHMWFGDLVTPRWWDGLWLKEAFATYMAFLAQAEATEYTEAWHLFYATSKQRAYVADQLVTTHPIEVDVDDTHYAFANFDDITYRKGASVLTQLSHLVGPDAFRAGVRRYLKAHEDGVTELADFIDALEQAADRRLSRWVADWLEQPGLNGVSVELRCEDGRVAGLSLLQTAPEETPVLRQHRVQIGLYRWQQTAGAFEISVLPAEFDGERTLVKAAAGLPCPDLVYPNHEDWGFVKVELDPVSLAAAERHLGDFDDPLLRSMLWQALWDRVRDARYSLTDYLETVLRVLPGESDTNLLLQVGATLGEAMAYLWGQPPAASRPLQDLGPRLEALAWSEAQRAASGSDRQILWLDRYRRLAHTPAALARLRQFLHGESLPDGVALDQDRRWYTLIRLNSFGYEDAGALAQAELARDSSETGQRLHVAVTAARPDAAGKQLWLDRIRSPDSDLSLSRRRSAMAALFPPHQRQLHADLAEEILSTLPAVGRAHQDAFLSSYGELIPRLCRPQSVARLAAAIDAYPDLNPILRRKLLVAHQEDARCLAISRAMSEPDGLPVR